MPPTFLFLLYKIVKEQTASKPSKISIRSTSLAQQPQLFVSVSSAPRLRCRASRSVKPTCQPLFSKKITNLIEALFFKHQQDFRPVNAASLLKSNITAQLFQPTPR